MDEKPLLVDLRDGVATLTLNRPASLNALNRALRASLVAALLEADRSEEVRAIILTGSGRAFCAGLDVKELSESAANVTEQIEGGDLGATISGLRTPIIAAVNGLAVTGGFEITLCCDIVIAGESAWFQDTHAKMGLLPGWGLSQRLPRVIGPYRAKEIALSLRKVSAAEAERFGFVTRVVADALLAGEAQQLAKAIAQWPAEHVRQIKRLIDKGYSMPFGEALLYESRQAQSLNERVSLANR